VKTRERKGAVDILADDRSPSAVERCARCRAFDSSELTNTRILALTVLMLLLSSATFAQDLSVRDAMAGHGFVALAPVSMTDDAHARLRGGRADDGSPWVVDGALFFRSNVGIGVEAVPLGSVTREQYYNSFESNDAEDDSRAVFIMARARAFAKRRFALDMVFGGAIVSQHWVFHSVSSSYGLPPVATVVTDRVVDDHRPALGIGIDGPLSLVPHLALLPIVRLYVVNHSAEIDNNGWSSRFTLGIGAGVKW